MPFSEVISSKNRKGKIVKGVKVKIINPHTWNTSSRHTKEALGSL